MIRITRAIIGIAAAAALLVPCHAATATAPASAEPRDAVFAVVDGTVIGTQEFEGALGAAIREKYYHRHPREEQLALLQREVADRLINRVLLLQEGQRRGIRPDGEKVRAQLANIEQRNRQQLQWQQDRERLLPALTVALEQQSVIGQLEAAARIAPAPDDRALHAYYAAHPELFTEPEVVRVSMILLNVDPAAPGAAWEAAAEKARGLALELEAGADFDELARQHSGDASARTGGDLGYRHRGMLPDGVEAEISRMVPGAISEPFRLLEGIAVFRVADRRAAQLKSFESVQRNVAELWARDQGEMQWRALLARLRAVADIRIAAGTPGGVNDAPGPGGAP